MNVNTAKIMGKSTFEVWSICAAYDKKFKRQSAAIRYAEKLGEMVEAIYEITPDGKRIQRDDLM